MNNSEAETLVNKIRSFSTQFDRLSGPFRVDPATGNELAFDKFIAEDWRRNTYGNAMIKLRLLTENNFKIIEQMSLLAVSRYVFELSVWLRLFQKDVTYCLVYYRELLESQLKHYRDLLEHLKREVELLKRFEGLEETSIKDLGKAKPSSDFGELMQKAMSRVDAEANRSFSLYLEDAKQNGYGFQAYLVEKKALPKAEEAISQIQIEIREFENKFPKKVQELAKKRWQWRRMAEEAGIQHEHDYIYAYASKLLHATPSSLTTDEKHLEMYEICIFLRYIHTKMLEIMDLAYMQPECKLKAMS